MAIDVQYGERFYRWHSTADDPIVAEEIYNEVISYELN